MKSRSSFLGFSSNTKVVNIEREQKGTVKLGWMGSVDSDPNTYECIFLGRLTKELVESINEQPKYLCLDGMSVFAEDWYVDGAGQCQFKVHIGPNDDRKNAINLKRVGMDFDLSLPLKQTVKNGLRQH